MAGVNKVILVGHLGQDPEVRHFPDSGGAVANVSIATSRSWKSKQTGELQEQTEWHRVVFRNRLAEIAGEYLKKGSQVYVEGALQTRKWQDKATGADRYTTEINVFTMQMLGKRGEVSGSNFDSSQSAPAQPASSPASSPAGSTASPDDFDDDIPF